MAKRWKCARCGTNNDEPTLTCSNCRMIRGAVVVKPQSPVPSQQRASEPNWLTPSTVGASNAPPTSGWVMPNENVPSKRRALLVLVSVLLFSGIVGAVLNASPIAPTGDRSGLVDFGISVLDDLQVGDCFDLEESETGTITSVTHRACDQPHQYELYLNESLTSVGYPSDAEFDELFGAECVAFFTAYVGESYGSSVLDIYWIVPSIEGWRQGDRTFQCAVYYPGNPRLTVPLKNFEIDTPFLETSA